jgi:hypothetical protein
VPNDKAKDFARKEMLNPEETLHRAERVGPFVVALVELPAGGYQNRVAQPAVILGGLRSRVPAVAIVSTHGRSAYPRAAGRFNGLVDDELA